jgi:FAD/FMN-containing dehydrogenase
MTKIFNSWGRTIFNENKVLENIKDLTKIKGTIYGNGRSYGDVCLNQNGPLIIDKSSKILNFDKVNGTIKVEAGSTLENILKKTLPYDWILPVTPGSKFVTLGGAIANNVHGKNHHISGSFGNFIKNIELLRSDGHIYYLSKSKNIELFNSTISGLGLTGQILNAEIKLKKIESDIICEETFQFNNIYDYFEIEKNFQENEYTVAWLDCLSSKKKLGRGVFFTGNHKKNLNKKSKLIFEPKTKINIKFDFPKFFLNQYSIKLFNQIYWLLNKNKKREINIDNFFYPLDKILNWNRIYGKDGFYQFQCIIPKIVSKKGIVEILKEITKSNQSSFLAVLKSHKEETSPGINNFCINGTSLALDFQNNQKSTINLLKKLETIVLNYDGKIYPAKDSIMSSDSYKKFYPNWKLLKEIKDPKLTSSFWERVSK